MPSLCGGLQGSHVSQSTGDPWGTHVPPTAVPDQQCAISHHSKDVGYHPAVGCGRKRTGTDSGRQRISTGSGRQRVSADTSHSKCIRDSGTTSGYKMPAPFLGPRCAYPRTG